MGLEVLTGLFKNKDKSGGTYYSGQSRKDGRRYYIFKNDTPKGDNPPDLWLKIQTEESKQTTLKLTEEVKEEKDDDVPF